MRKAPTIYNLAALMNANQDQANINGKWVPARPVGFFSIGNRLRCAWLVFTGKCDLVRWPEGQ